jgi:hypothetical protein
MSATTRRPRIDLTRYQATPGALITSELVQTIIQHVNALDKSVTTLQNVSGTPAETTGPSPVILNVYGADSRGGQTTSFMHIDPDATSTIIEGQDFDGVRLVRLDSIEIDLDTVRQSTDSSGVMKLTLTSVPLPDPTIPGYRQTTLASEEHVALIAVTTDNGTGSRLVIIDQPKSNGTGSGATGSGSTSSGGARGTGS